MPRKAPYILLLSVSAAAGYSIYHTHNKQASDRAQMYQGVIRDIEREKARLNNQRGRENKEHRSSEQTDSN